MQLFHAIHDEHERFQQALEKHGTTPDLEHPLVYFTSVLKKVGTYPFGWRFQVAHPEQVFYLLQPFFEVQDRQEMVALLLDQANHVIGFSLVGTGSIKHMLVEPRQIFKVAMLSNASAIILVHHHPSGVMDLTVEDVAFVSDIKEIGEILEIPLEDYLKVTWEGYVSYQQEAWAGTLKEAS